MCAFEYVNLSPGTREESSFRYNLMAIAFADVIML